MELFEKYRKWGKDITVFDVDDTLIVTKSKIRVFNPKQDMRLILHHKNLIHLKLNLMISLILMTLGI